MPIRSEEYLDKVRQGFRREVIEDLIRHLRALLATTEDQPDVGDLRGKGITEAAQIILRKTGPRGTREIAQLLLANGIETRSKNFTATLYMSLRQAPTKFKRLPDGNWDLARRK